MSAQDDPARGSRSAAGGTWIAESPFVGEAAEEKRAPIDPWYQGHTPFVEGRD